MTNHKLLYHLKKGKIFFLFICVIFLGSNCKQTNNSNKIETDFNKNKIVSSAKDTSTIINSSIKIKLSCCKWPSRMRAFTQASK